MMGTVVSGKGWHSANMGQWDVLPFRAFPGTLNVQVGEAAVAELRAAGGRVTVFDGVEFFWWPCRVGGVTGVVTWNVGCADGVVEVVAPVRLRDLPLSDGDRVEVRV